MSEVVKEVPLTKTTFFIGLALSAIIIIGAIYVLTKYNSKLENLFVPQRQELSPELKQEEVEKSPFITDITNDTDGINSLVGNGKSKVVLVYATWCGHCRNMMKAYHAAASLERSVEWYRIEAASSPSVSRRNDLKGFPTIYAVSPDGTLSQHNGSRDTSTLINFAKSIADSVPIIEKEEVKVTIEEN